MIRLIAETLEQSNVWYKGLYPWAGSIHFPHKIGAEGTAKLGFLGTLRLAMIYAEPLLTGKALDKTLLISAIIHDNQIEDRTEEFLRLGYTDVSVSYPIRWRNEGPWTVRMERTSHGDENFVFCGIKWPYQVIAVFNNQDEWEIAAKHILLLPDRLREESVGQPIRGSTPLAINLQ